MYNLECPKILDIGCSTGEFFEAVFKQTKVNYFGIEPSNYAAKIAEAKGISMVESPEEVNEADCVIYRGTIQYIESPFESITKSAKALKKGGLMIFLATPNCRSMYYYLFRTLPFLENKYMYFIPSDANMELVLKNAGMKLRSLEYPYLKTPYARPIKDTIRFIYKLVTGKGKFAWPGSMMWIIAEKR